MTFLALNMNTSFLIAQRSDLEFDEMMYSNKYNEITQEISAYASKTGSSGSTKSSGSTNSSSSTKSSQNTRYMEYLKSQQDYYESKKNSIESQLKSINAQVESYQKTVENNIKSECKLSISA